MVNGRLNGFYLLYKLLYYILEYDFILWLRFKIYNLYEEW